MRNAHTSRTYTNRPIRFWLLRVLTACCACSLVAYSTILVWSEWVPNGRETPRTYPHPYISSGQSPNPSIQASNQKGKARDTAISTHRRPPSTFHSEATKHQQREPLQLWDNLISLTVADLDRNQPTLSHKVFQMMPFHIVGQITDIDVTFLLRRITNRSHHLLLGLSTLLVRTRGSGATSSASVARISSRCPSCATHRRTRAAIGSAIIVSASGATPRRI